MVIGGHTEKKDEIPAVHSWGHNIQACVEQISWYCPPNWCDDKAFPTSILYEVPIWQYDIETD